MHDNKNSLFIQMFQLSSHFAGIEAVHDRNNWIAQRSNT